MARILWDDEPTQEALGQRRHHRSALDDVDVIVIGAGFTGLWTAYHLLVQDPSTKVVLVEANHVGFGASGRNGGWCTPEIPLSLDEVDRRHGPGSAFRWRSALVDTVDEIRRFCDDQHIDAQWADGGWLQWARTAAQEQRVRALVDDYRRHGFDERALRWLDADEANQIARASGVRGASFSTQTSAIHPGRLVRGLAAAVERNGGVIIEGLRVTDVTAHGVTLDRHRVAARWVVRATEGYTSRLPGAHRDLIPVYSMMIATAPLAQAQWQEIGLDDRAVFNDARRTVIYGQRTADDRLAFGGRGAPYHLRSGIAERFDTHDTTRRRLRDSLVELFPTLGDVEVTHHWGGPLGIPRDWHPHVGVDHQRGWAWAGGFVGEGVVASALAGRTLAELILDRPSPRATLAWVGHRSPRWEIEPVRWLGINAMVALARCADRRERRGSASPRLADALLGRWLGH